MIKRAPGIRIILSLSIVAVVAWAVPRHPIYEEWRLSHLPLEQLERERGQRLDDFRLLYYTGLRLIAKTRYAEALPLLLQAARLQPDEARIRDALAQAQVALGKTGEAFNQLTQFVGTHPDVAAGRLSLGKFYLAMKSGKRAQEELERAVTLDPNLAEGWSTLASALIEFSPDRAAAIDAARHAAYLRPQNAGDHLALAALLAEQLPQKARAEFECALTLAPKRADILRRYADFLLSTGSRADQARAEADARLAVGLDAAAPTAYLVLGRALIRRGADTEAIEPLMHAAELDPYDTAAPRELVNLCHRRGRRTEFTRWEQVLKQRQDYLCERQTLLDAALVAPQDRQRSLRLARLLGRHGEVVEALRYQGLAQGKLSDAPSVLIATACDLTNGGFADRALPLARRGLEIAPSSDLAAAARQLLDRIQTRLPEHTFRQRR